MGDFDKESGVAYDVQIALGTVAVTGEARGTCRGTSGRVDSAPKTKGESMIARGIAIGLVVATISAVCCAQTPSVVAPGAQGKKLAGDFGFTEGPAADVKGDVYFTDIPNNKILKWSVREGKLSTFRENSSGANGLYFDKAGNLLACEGNGRRIVSISPTGEVTVLVDQYEGKKFNSPNDLWIDPKGGVYFTDPRYGSREGMEQPGEYVFYLTPDRKKTTVVATDLTRPNGIIGAPDGKTLYIADHAGGKTYVYKINEDGTLADKQLFAPQGSDGMTIDSDGNIYQTSNVVTVYNAKGQKLQEIQVPEEPANVTFGGPNDKTLFITARTSLYALDMVVKGVKTPVQKAEQPVKQDKPTEKDK
jgi:gluconolactonase